MNCFVCFHRGGEKWTNELQWKNQSQFKNASYVDWKNYGEYKTVENFTFLRVYQAGHMVPMDQPAAALEMLNAFVQGKSL